MNAIDYPWWLASRAAGTTAYVLLTLAVCCGLLMALRRVPRHLRVLVRVAHERVALLALGFVAVHGLVLLGDSWLKAGVADLLIPFHMRYRPFWTGLGILAAYSAAGPSLTRAGRREVGRRSRDRFAGCRNRFHVSTSPPSPSSTVPGKTRSRYGSSRSTENPGESAVSQPGMIRGSSRL